MYSFLVHPRKVAPTHPLPSIYGRIVTFVPFLSFQPIVVCKHPTPSPLLHEILQAARIYKAFTRSMAMQTKAIDWGYSFIPQGGIKESTRLERRPFHWRLRYSLKPVSECRYEAPTRAIIIRSRSRQLITPRVLQKTTRYSWNGHQCRNLYLLRLIMIPATGTLKSDKWQPAVNFQGRISQ